MKLVLCPRCELNYMTPEEQYCKICMQELHSSGPVDEVELCSVCNENPVLPGHDVCLMCLKEIGGGAVSSDGTQEEGVDSIDIGMDSVATMDEILPMEPEADSEFGVMEHALSLDQVREEEEKEEENEDEDDDR